MARKTTQEEVEKAISLRLEGRTIEDIAEILDRSTDWARIHTKSVPASVGNRSCHTTCKNVIVAEKKRLRRYSKLLRRMGGIPIVYGGLDTTKM